MNASLAIASIPLASLPLASFTLAMLVDLVIAITAIEGAALVLYHRATGRGVAPREFAANLLSGVCLMLALRCFARDAGTAWIALCLLAAGVAHVTDLSMRWRRQDTRAASSTQEFAA